MSALAVATGDVTLLNRVGLNRMGSVDADAPVRPAGSARAENDVLYGLLIIHVTGSRRQGKFSYRKLRPRHFRFLFLHLLVSLLRFGCRIGGDCRKGAFRQRGGERQIDFPFLTEGLQLLQMSTTLEKLVLNTRHYWGGKTGPIRTSVFPYPLPSVMRWLLPAMYGGENRKPPPRSTSFCSRELAVTSKAMFVIDGEFFPPPTDEPLRLETGPVFTYVCG